MVSEISASDRLQYLSTVSQSSSQEDLRKESLQKEQIFIYLYIYLFYFFFFIEGVSLIFSLQKIYGRN